MLAICPASAGWDLLGGVGDQHTLSIGAGLPRLLSVLFHPALDHVVLTSAALHQQEPSPGIENPSAVQSLGIPSS